MEASQGSCTSESVGETPHSACEPFIYHVGLEASDTLRSIDMRIVEELDSRPDVFLRELFPDAAVVFQDTRRGEWLGRTIDVGTLPDTVRVYGIRTYVSVLNLQLPPAIQNPHVRVFFAELDCYGIYDDGPLAPVVDIVRACMPSVCEVHITFTNWPPLLEHVPVARKRCADMRRLTVAVELQPGSGDVETTIVRRVFDQARRSLGRDPPCVVAKAVGRNVAMGRMGTHASDVEPLRATLQSPDTVRYVRQFVT